MHKITLRLGANSRPVTTVSTTIISFIPGHKQLHIWLLLVVKQYDTVTKQARFQMLSFYSTQRDKEEKLITNIRNLLLKQEVGNCTAFHSTRLFK